ncbi:hypothetical protein Leryth_014022 [Lithospermum erythrorhizon]|nr:hypothetical protein Leryth_014022 [Lithospermum erythrorhizon]
MLVGGDLGFWFRLVVGFIAVLFPPALGLVVRHKWRRAAARREEIKRLCVLASEEAALAELESKSEYGYGYGYERGSDYSYGYGYEDGNINGFGYGGGEVEGPMADVALETKGVGGGGDVAMPGRSSQKVMHPCARCSCPTNQKCARCKSVYYCSGKCQIVHWRQGHKDECQPYNLSQKRESEMKSHLKVSKLEENERGDNFFETGEDSRAKPAETSNNSSTDSGLSAVHSRKDDLKVVHLEDDNKDYQASKSVDPFKDVSGTNDSHVSHSSHSSSRSSRQLSAKMNEIKIQTDPTNNVQSHPSASERDFSISSVDDTPRRNPQIRPSNDDKDKDCAPSTLSGSGVGLSGKSSSREPSMPISDFWDGKLVQVRHETDSPDDSSQFSNEADEHDVIGYHVSSHAISKTSSLARSQETIAETKKRTNMYTHVAEEFDGDVSRESIKSGSRHVKPTVVSFKPILQTTKLVPSTSSDKVESMTQGTVKSGISLNKLESKKSDSVISKQAMDPLPPGTHGHIGTQNVVKDGKMHSTTTSSLKFSGTKHNANRTFESSKREGVDVFKNSTPLKQHTRGSGAQMLTKYKGLFPYELFVKLYNWKEVEFRPPGFVNCGNSCYANAVLNCLASTPPLTSYFLQGLHSKSCEKRDWCFTCEFESLTLRAKVGASPLSPIRIISHLQNIGSHLRNGREEDAHEFLRFAIDAMQSTCLTEAGVKESGSLDEGTTLTGLTFGGIVRSKIECMRCGGKSERKERMMDLTVEIQGNIGTLEEALRQYTSVETLDGDNKYRCDWCKSYEKAKKKLKVLEAPNVLTIALKRYQSGEFGKLNKTIQFPEILNLAPYICGTSDKSPIYGLYGVIVHLDTMNAAFSGHYVCYVKNTQNQWFMVDDSVVKKVDIGKVLTKDAYMLLYARYSPRAPRLIRSSVIPRDPRNTKFHMCKSRSISRDSWEGVSTREDPLHGEACHECTNSVHASLRSRTTNPDYGSSGDNSSFFSETGSYGTDSSNRDSASTEEHLDFVAMSTFWNNSGRSSSDSDTSSSSSSPSPLSLRQSPLADAKRYASVTGVETIKHGSKNYGIWRSASSGDLENSNREEEDHFQHSDSGKQLKQFSSSSRENEANRLGRINPFEKVKLGFPFRRSTNDRPGNILI